VAGGRGDKEPEANRYERNVRANANELIPADQGSGPAPYKITPKKPGLLRARRDDQKAIGNLGGGISRARVPPLTQHPGIGDEVGIRDLGKSSNMLAAKRDAKRAAKIGRKEWALFAISGGGRKDFLDQARVWRRSSETSISCILAGLNAIQIEAHTESVRWARCRQEQYSRHCIAQQLWSTCENTSAKSIEYGPTLEADTATCAARRGSPNWNRPDYNPTR